MGYGQGVSGRWLRVGSGVEGVGGLRRRSAAFSKLSAATGIYSSLLLFLFFSLAATLPSQWRWPTVALTLFLLLLF